MSKILFILIFPLIIFSCIGEQKSDIQKEIAGEELVIGDTTVVGIIKEQTSKIYAEKDKTFFYLSKSQLRKVKTYGTSIVAHLKNDTINRIIAVSLTKKGQLSTEWYFSKNKLIYVYESFEFFEEEKRKSGWKNFKGLSAWESRYYFMDKEIKYQKHKGRKDIKEKDKANDVLKDGRTIMDYVAQQQLKKE